jgi:hypothetical protein
VAVYDKQLSLLNSLLSQWQSKTNSCLYWTLCDLSGSLKSLSLLTYLSDRLQSMSLLAYLSDRLQSMSLLTYLSDRLQSMSLLAYPSFILYSFDILISWKTALWTVSNNQLINWQEKQYTNKYKTNIKSEQMSVIMLLYIRGTIVHYSQMRTNTSHNKDEIFPTIHHG